MKGSPKPDYVDDYCRKPKLSGFPSMGLIATTSDASLFGPRLVVYTFYVSICIDMKYRYSNCGLVVVTPSSTPKTQGSK